MERRLTAILAADVVGYSQLMGEDQARTLDALRQLRGELFEPIVAEHRGNVVKRLGDGWIVEFPSISDAAACAIAIQEGLAGHHTIQLRIGIHTGEVVFEADDVFGDGVNVAARLETLADPGQVLISDSARNGLDGKTADQFMGGETHELKNIARPVAVWRWPAANGAETAAEAEVLALPDKPSIAVLPFNNMSGDTEQEYFADGIAEDIITGLSRMRWFFVCARNSSFLYKGRSVDMKQVSNELGVRYVLEGSVRKSGNRVRVTAQLIDATTGNHLWADRFDRELDDIFAVQDEITETVVATIEPQLYVAESERARRKSTGNIDAWDLTMRAMRLLWRLNGQDNERAQELLCEAIELDPDYASAYGPLGFSYTWHAWMGWGTDPVDLIPKADAVARRAVVLDDQDPWSYLAMAGVYAYQRRHQDALDELRICLELNPNFALAHAWLAIVLGYGGKLEEANEAVDRANRISPRDPFNTWLPVIRSIAYFTAEKDAEARELAKETIKLRPEMVGAWRIVAITCAHMGQTEEAQQALAEVKRLQPTISLDWARAYGPWVRPQDLERYVEGLRLAGLE